MSFLNHVVEFCKVISSEVVGANGATLYNLTGIAGFSLDAEGQIAGEDESDEGGEQAHQQPGYQALGIIARPLPPEGDVFAEAIAVRTEDGLVPAAWRDLRLHRAVNPGGGATTPRAGQIMLAHYGGGFLSHAMTEGATGSKRGTISTWYVPYEFDGSGVPTKAHAISIDPSDGNQSISIVHGDGVFLTLTADAGTGSPGIVWAVDAQTFGRIAPGEFTVNAAKITLKGNTYLGRAAEGGVPMLGGPITPPSPSVFISPV